MEDVAVYVCTGFLESGKTTFIKDTLVLQDFMEDGLTLLLVCEEGEEEYEESFLKSTTSSCSPLTAWIS